ncbi:hypothetical protein GCM10023188_07140 [Pontibacter saemangeumensis]|uniref:Uncharacterized protein n=1 Tax=Pontibacter saemangeumensis TaxID=1084525 RepID=A0ABP8LA71_9BACT
MKKKLCLLGLLGIAVACSPKNEEVQDEQVTVAPPTEALDSIANTKKDGVKTDENDTDPTMPMPPPVMQLLTEQYPGWEKPTLTEEAREQTEGDLQGPTLVRGDFNGDTLQDLALQLQQDKDLVVVAAMQEQENLYRLYEIKRDILFNERGNLKSLYYLYLVEQGEPLQTEDANEDVEAVHDALAIGIEGEENIYIYENGSFTPYSLNR